MARNSALAEFIEELKARRRDLMMSVELAHADYEQRKAAMMARIEEIDLTLKRLEPPAAETRTAQDQPKRQAPGAVENAIIKELSNDFGAMTAEDLIARTHLRAPSVRSALKKLTAAGKLRLTASGYLLAKGSDEGKARGEFDGAAMSPD